MPVQCPYDQAPNVCSANKPHKCPPCAVCYGRYHYCSASSKTAEPCISETYLTDLDSRKTLCQEIAEGKNITELVRHPACTLKADCFDEFETLFYPSTRDDTTWTYYLAICLGILFVIALITVVILAVLCHRLKAKRNTNDNEQDRMPGSDSIDTQINNVNGSHSGNGNQKQQPVGPEDSNTSTNTNLNPPPRLGGNDAANARNSPDFGKSSGPGVIYTPPAAFRGSRSNRNRNHSPENSSASISSEPPEANQTTNTLNRPPQDHPAEVEFRLQSNMNMPSSENEPLINLTLGQGSQH